MRYLIFVSKFEFEDLIFVSKFEFEDLILEFFVVVFL
jgi:hypothetical protein